MNIRILSIVVFFISIVAANAQTVTPVDAKFFGAWTFDSAEAQERPADSNQSYVTRNASQDEFRQKLCLLNVPTQIIYIGDFTGDFMAHIVLASWSKPVIALMNNGLLEFRDFQENSEDSNKTPEISEINSYPTITPAFILTQSGSLMSLQFNYTYSDTQNKPAEGIMTIYYNRF